MRDNPLIQSLITLLNKDVYLYQVRKNSLLKGENTWGQGWGWGQGAG